METKIETDLADVVEFEARLALGVIVSAVGQSIVFANQHLHGFQPLHQSAHRKEIWRHIITNLLASAGEL
jgi:hypothetical protein